MSQTRLHVTAPRSAATRIYAGLEQAFEDEGFPLAILEVDEARDIHEVSIYVDADEIGRAEAEMRRIIGSTGEKLVIENEALPDIDWVARSLEGLKPVRAGRFFVHGAHDRTLSHVGSIAIEIEAGLAFGTGHHGTTAGCLEMIDRVVRRERPRNALDLGAGSAVLAIAVAKLGKIPVLASDIDPVAVRVARQNVRLNGASAHVHAVAATGFRHPAFVVNAPFDLIVANILARPLMQLAADMARHVTPGGSLILSGILDRQRDAVVAAYVGQRFRHVTTLHHEGWVTLHLKR